MNAIHASHHIDDAKFGKVHLKIIIACALLLIVDGYDVFIYGVVLPSLMQDWQLTAPEAGALASWALLGMMSGALLFGPLGDKIGRKACIAICFILFSVATFFSGFATTPLIFGILRFAAGLGCGGLMPNAVALTNEFAPKRMRSTLVALMFSGYAVGGMVAAGLGIWMLPLFGWQAMFWAAGLPLLALPFILRGLPESIGFLIRKGRDKEARASLAQLVGEPIPAGRLIFDDSSSQRTSIAELFRHNRTVGTIAMWISFFCCLLMVYALGSWLPQLMREAGYSLGSSLSFLLALNFGGMFGAIAGGRLADRFGLPRVVMGYFLLGAICISLLGFKPPMALLYLLIFIAGAGTTGTQILLYACVADFYSLSVRSTGLGWASGMGRVGAIVGPMLGGLLLAAKLPMTLNFVVFAIPGVIAVMATLVYSLSRSNQTAAPAPLPG